MNTFPALSETYVLWHMVELVKAGVDLEIWPVSLGNTERVHDEVRDFDLLQRTYPLAELSARTPAKKVQERAKLILSAFRRNPRMAVSAMPMIGGLANIGWANTFAHLAEYTGEKAFDVIHAYFGPPGRRAVQLRDVGAFRGPIVTSFLGYDVNVLGTRYGGEYYRHLFDRADRISVSSEFMRRKLLELGAPEKRVVLLPLGLPVERFAFKERTAPADGPVRIATAARLTEVKGIEWGVRAIAEAAKRGAHIRWDILGDGPLRGSLEALAEGLGVQDLVHFHGMQPMPYVQRVLEEAHIGMLPGVRAADGAEEALGGAVLEAQACGLPVLTTDAGGIGEGIVDGVSGVRVPQRDAGALADGIMALLARAGEWPSMGRAGRQHVAENYDCAALNDRWLALYRKLA